MTLSWLSLGAGALALILVCASAPTIWRTWARFSVSERLTASYVFIVGALLSVPSFYTGLVGSRVLVLDSYGRLESAASSGNQAPPWLEFWARVLLVFVGGVYVALSLHVGSVSRQRLNPRALVALAVGVTSLGATALASEEVFSLQNIAFLSVLICACFLVPSWTSIFGVGVFVVFVVSLSGLATALRPDQTFVGCERKCSVFGAVYYGLYLNENALGLVVAIGVGVCWFLFIGWQQLAVIVCLLTSVIATGSRTSIIASLVTAAICMFLSRVDGGLRPKVDRIPGVRLMLILLAALWPFSILFSGAADDLTGRPQLWASAMDYFVASPFFGWGASRWVTNGALGLFDSAANYSAHNQFYDTAFVAGVVGLVGLGYLIVTALWQNGLASRLSAVVLLVPVTVIGFTERAFGVGSLDWLAFSYAALILVCGSSQRVLSTGRSVTRRTSERVVSGG